MVKDFLDNDFYIGTFRLKKRARKTVHGKDKRVPKEEQCVFENHHPAIIEKATFDLVQELKEKRNRTNYRGSRGQWPGSEIPNPFGSCLYCKDCGSRLTPIKRQTSNRVRKYYICSAYNTKGKLYCSKAHLIEEDDLMQDVLTYIKMCRNTLCEVIAAYDTKDFEAEKKSLKEKRQELNTAIDLRKDQLKELDETSLEAPDVKDRLRNALDVVDKIISGGTFARRDIELLIDRIDVDENGMPEITLKYGLSSLIQYSPTEEMNRRENTSIAIVMLLICEEEHGCTSARYLSDHITELGFTKTKKSILPYIALMKEPGILEDTDNPLKPYNIMKSKEEIAMLISRYVPGLPADITAKQLSDKYLHFTMYDRRRTYINVTSILALRAPPCYPSCLTVYPSNASRIPIDCSANINIKTGAMYLIMILYSFFRLNICPLDSISSEIHFGPIIQPIRTHEKNAINGIITLLLM